MIIDVIGLIGSWLPFWTYMLPIFAFVVLIAIIKLIVMVVTLHV